jgi:HSP20 family molecular chaperone IbpA
VPRRNQDEVWFFRVGGDLQRLSDDLIRGIVASTSAARRFWRPCADVFEDESNIWVTVELAGVDPDAVSVHLAPSRGSLTIRGRRNPPADCGDGQRSHQLEIFYGDFERELDLPSSAIEPDRITASFENGILRICVPKRSATFERRNIRITEKNG